MWDLFRAGGGGTCELRLGTALGLLPWHFNVADLCPSLLHPLLTSPPPASLGFFSYHKLCPFFLLLLLFCFFFSSSAASKTL